jgi:hypothetical protein
VGRHHGTVSVRPRTEVVSGIHARGQRLLESRGVIARVCTGGKVRGAVGLCVEAAEAKGHLVGSAASGAVGSGGESSPGEAHLTVRRRRCGCRGA